MRCFAVAVPDAPTPTALSVSGPAARVTYEFGERAVPVLHRVASELTRAAHHRSALRRRPGRSGRVAPRPATTVRARPAGPRGLRGRAGRARPSWSAQQNPVTDAQARGSAGSPSRCTVASMRP